MINWLKKLINSFSKKKKYTKSTSEGEGEEQKSNMLSVFEIKLLYCLQTFVMWSKCIENGLKILNFNISEEIKVQKIIG